MKKRRLSKNFINNLYSFLFFLVLIAIWEIISRTGLTPGYILPAPDIILYNLFLNLKLIDRHILVTVYETLTGFIISIFIGTIIAVIMDGIPLVKKVIYPLLITTQTIPIITLAPLFIIWFGYGYLPKIIIVVLICFFPISISLMQGLSSVDTDLINLLKSMGAGRYKIFTLVKFPSSLPGFFSGLKIAATYSIMGATIGEWVGGKDGLGVYMLRARYSFATDKVFGAIIIITVLSICLLKIIEFIERKAMPWTVFEKFEILE
ncbi:MAG: ABC transporter permease [Actinobacteria bacterium]|nr:ABC transporter permease [Actinomycetota bacterium]